jgi:hypothetical protein
MAEFYLDIETDRDRRIGLVGIYDPEGELYHSSFDPPREGLRKWLEEVLPAGERLYTFTRFDLREIEAHCGLMLDLRMDYVDLCAAVSGPRTGRRPEGHRGGAGLREGVPVAD